MKNKILSLLLVLTLIVSVFTGCTKAPANDDDTKISDNKGNDNDDEEEENTQEILSYLTLRKVGNSDAEYDNSDGSYKCYVQYSYSGVELCEEDATLYPELDASLKALNDELYNLTLDEYSQYKTWAEESLANGEEAYFPYFTDRDLLVRRADSRVLSLSALLSNYSGGAHGWAGDFPRSYDVKTGKEIKFVDIVKDIDKMYDYITERLKEKYIDEWDMFIQFDTDEDPYELYKNGTAEQGFYFNNEGITVVFNPYDLAAYAVGSQQVYIPYEGNEELFTDGSYFEEHMDNYSVGISAGNPYTGNIFGDGEEHTFAYYVGVDQEDTDYIENLYFSVDNQSYTIKAEFYAFSYNAYLLKSSNGKVYFYLMTSEFNDYKIVYVYEVNKDGVTLLEETTGYIWTPAVESDRWWSWGGVLVDPDNFYVDIRTDILGTTHIYALSHIGENGLFAPYDEVYTFAADLSVTLKQSITVDVVSESGDKTGTMTLNPGDVLKAYRTDNSTYVDLLTKDKTIVRINVTATYPFEVDGIPMDELFDGIMYAG